MKAWYQEKADSGVGSCEEFSLKVTVCQSNAFPLASPRGLAMLDFRYVVSREQGFWRRAGRQVGVDDRRSSPFCHRPEGRLSFSRDPVIIRLRVPGVCRI